MMEDCLIREPKNTSFKDEQMVLLEQSNDEIFIKEFVEDDIVDPSQFHLPQSLCSLQLRFDSLYVFSQGPCVFNLLINACFS